MKKKLFLQIDSGRGISYMRVRGIDERFLQSFLTLVMEMDECILEVIFFFFQANRGGLYLYSA